jgi:hypothetical protein
MLFFSASRILGIAHVDLIFEYKIILHFLPL